MLINGSTVREVGYIVTGRLRDSLDGELSLSFTLTEDDAGYVSDTTVVCYNGQYFTVVDYTMEQDGQSPVCSVSCEHVSNCLNDETYNVDNFVFTGTPAAALAAVLSGTPISAGTVEPTGSVNISLAGGSRRAVLVSVAALCGGEIEYDGYAVNLRTHRGNQTAIELLDTDNVAAVAYTRSVRDNITSYSITLGRRTALAAGDRVHIKYTPLDIDVTTRIIAVDCNPYDDTDAEIEVGDYVPDILDAYAEEIKDAVEEANEYTDETAEALSEDIASAEANAAAAAAGTAALNTTVTSQGAEISALATWKATTYVNDRQVVYDAIAGVSAQANAAQATADLFAQWQSTTYVNDKEATQQSLAAVQTTANAAGAQVNIIAQSGIVNGTTGVVCASIIAQAINGASGIKIAADRLDLSGVVTISAANTPGAVTIYGGNIQANSADVGIIKNVTINGDSAGVWFPNGLRALYLIANEIISTGTHINIGGTAATTVYIPGTLQAGTINAGTLRQSGVDVSLCGHTHTGYAAAADVNAAYSQANAAYNRANSAYSQANSAYGQANSAYALASTAYSMAYTANTNAGSAATIAAQANNTADNALYTAQNHNHTGVYAPYFHSHTEYSLCGHSHAGYVTISSTRYYVTFTS